MIRRTRPPESPARGEPPPVSEPASVAPSAQPGTRYVVERCAGGGDRAVYAVVDLERKQPHRVVCRTGYRDASMIAGALKMTDWRREYVELVKKLWRGYTVYTSNGSTSATFDRHIWPVIAAARKTVSGKGKDDGYARSEVILALAEELREARCGAADLDLEIATALGINLRNFTTSIDDALTLTSRDEYDYVLKIEVGAVNGQVGGTPYARVGRHTGYGATPCLSLCAASLKALAEPDVLYAVGYKGDDGSYGMVYGPVYSIEECLGFVPEDDPRPCCILECREGGENGVAAEWDAGIGGWVRETPAPE